MVFYILFMVQAIFFMFFMFCVIISVNAGLVSTWKMMGRLVWMLMNAPLPSLVASAASTPMGPTGACVWTGMNLWIATTTHAKRYQVSSIVVFSFWRISSHKTFSPLMPSILYFSWGALSHYGRPPRDPQAECRWFKLHHLKTGNLYLHRNLYLIKNIILIWCSVS